MSNTTTPISLNIPPQGYVELEYVANHASKLADVVSVSAELPLSASASEVRESVAAKISVSVEVAGTLISGLATLRNLMQLSDATAAQILDALTSTLSFSNKSIEWRKRNLPMWLASRSSIESVVQSIGLNHPMIVRQKALELTYAHQNIFKRSRIMTDIRPVFDASGGEISAMVLTHVLSIEYFDGVRGQRIEFALDQNDVNDLQEATERARKKTGVAIRDFRQQKWPLIVAGDAPRTD